MSAVTPIRPEGLFVRGGRDAEAPTRILMDLTKQDAGEILAGYAERRSNYATAPFDPTGERIRFYRGGITIWSGYPGSGKTTLLRQLACHLLHQGRGVFFASLEEDPEDLVVRLAGVAFGTDEPTSQQLQWFLDWYEPTLRLWGVIGIARHKQLLGVIEMLSQPRIIPNRAEPGAGYTEGPGVTHAIIDSLMCLDITNDDFEGQRKFANLMAATARSTGVHIHLVAHPRKAISADQEPDLNDVAGAREIGGIADNVLFVRRLMQSQPFGECSQMKVMIRKQRHYNGWLGEITGVLNRRLKQFKLDQFDQVPTQYLPKQAYE